MVSIGGHEHVSRWGRRHDGWTRCGGRDGTKGIVGGLARRQWRCFGEFGRRTLEADQRRIFELLRWRVAVEDGGRRASSEWTIINDPVFEVYERGSVP